MPRPVEWLWWPYIPFGKITAVAGQMGQAKSLFTVWLASAATTGHGVNTTPGGVIMLSAEDDAEDTIRPRLEAAGADLDRVWIEPGADLDPKRLAAICAELDGTVLVTIDPVTAYFPGTVNSWKAQDVRRTLEPIRELAAERAIAVVLVQHLNRRADAAEPLSRIADSQGIPQLARSVLIWGPDPSDPRRRPRRQQGADPGQGQPGTRDRQRHLRDRGEDGLERHQGAQPPTWGRLRHHRRRRSRRRRDPDLDRRSS